RAEGGKGDAGTEYRIEVKGNFDGVTGIRLEALADAKLPAKGPGRSTNGYFILTEFEVAQVSATGKQKQVKFASAAATFDQPSFPAAAAIDGKRNDRTNGWGVLGGTGTDQAIYFEQAEPF